MGDQHLKEQPVASSTTPKAVRTVGTALIVCATMKTLVTLTLVLLSSQHTGRAGDFINPESSPRLTIKSVYRNRSEPDLLSVVVQFSATKEGPVALTQDQVSIHITTADKPHLFVSDATFQKKASTRLLIKPGSPVSFALQVGKNRFGKKRSWSSLPPGEYRLQAYVNAGEQQEFDYHWLGQTYSDAWTLQLPIRRSKKQK